MLNNLWFMVAVLIILSVIIVNYVLGYNVNILGKTKKQLAILMVKEDTPLYKDGVRAEQYAYQQWNNISALTFDDNCIHFEECTRDELVNVVTKLYSSGVKWFCGALTSQSSLVMKPFMDTHKDCVLQTTFSTVPSVKFVDNIFRMLNNIEDTTEYRKWLMSHIRKLYPSRETLLFTQNNDVWSNDLGKEFEDDATYKLTISSDSVFKRDDLDKIKANPGSLIICLTLDWKKALDQLYKIGLKGYQIYMANTIAYRYDMSDKHKWIITNNKVFGSTPYPLTSGITYIANKFESYTIPPSISSLYWVFLDAMRWIASDIKSPYEFTKKMCSKDGMYYYDKYGDQADIRVVMIEANVDKKNDVEWKTLSSSGYRQTFGHFFADYTVKKNLHERG